MRHDYYYYNKEELLRDPKIPLIVMDDNHRFYLPGWSGWPVSIFCGHGQ